MSDNPLRDSPEHDARIRERAYHLWLADGSPHGRDVEYWERARELIGIEESPGAGLLRDTAVQGETIEEADIQENLGEFPDRFTDQGNRQETPMTRAEARKRAKEE